MRIITYYSGGLIWEDIKPGTEPEVIVAQYGRGDWICYGKLVLICQAYQYTES